MPRERPIKSHASRDLAWLADMLTASRKVVRFVAGRTREQYLEDEQLRSAVERQVMIIGEAAYHVTAEFRAAHPEIAWRQIAAQRHRIVHEYSTVDDELVWTVASVHVPELLVQVEALLKRPPGDAAP
jgi:uncharacterized protein with HEPN domain